MGILRFIIRRLFFMVFLVIGVSVIIFFMINAIGDPIELLMAERPGIITLMLVLANLLTDIAYVFIDPRISLE
jgi:ABC-type dipeptide/oligopeptide/nickel transport system permease component